MLVALSWTRLRELLAVRPALVIDAANVVGSVPDGWWRDRPGAAARLLSSVQGLIERGVDATALGLGADTWFPEVSVVVEGQARAVAEVSGIRLVRAEGHGDDAIVAEASRLVTGGRTVTVVTSDRGLAERADAVGAGVRPVSWLRDLL